MEMPNKDQAISSQRVTAVASNCCFSASTVCGAPDCAPHSDVPADVLEPEGRRQNRHSEDQG